jgi:hypothetical protein
MAVGEGRRSTSEPQQGWIEGSDRHGGSCTFLLHLKTFTLKRQATAGPTLCSTGSSGTQQERWPLWLCSSCGCSRTAVRGWVSAGSLRSAPWPAVLSLRSSHRFRQSLVLMCPGCVLRAWNLTRKRQSAGSGATQVVRHFAIFQLGLHKAIQKRAPCRAVGTGGVRPAAGHGAPGATQPCKVRRVLMSVALS